MKKKTVFTGFAGIAILALALTGCAGGAGGEGGSEGGEGGSKEATILTNWFAQAEQGGYWAAQAEGLAEDDGVTLTVNQGGPGIQTIPQVAAGEADFGVGNADEILVAVKSGIPIVAVAAGPAKNLQCMAYHKSSGVSSFGDLNGHTVARVPSPYWTYIRDSFKLNDVNEINIGDLASFQNDKKMVTQCFITSEPFIIDKMGIEDVGYLSVPDDGGYNAYQNLLFTTQKFIDENPETVQAVVDASVKGWSAMLVDPTATKELIMKTNSDGDPDVFDYTIDLFKDDESFLGGDKVGQLTEARWNELTEQLISIKELPEGFDPSKAFTTQFIK